MSNDQEVLSELKRMTRLLALMVTKDMSQADQIRLLSQADFRSVDIAEMLGIKANIVRATVSQQRKKGTK